MLSVLATLPRDRGGLDAGVIYIDTEAAFSATRLVTLNGVLYFACREVIDDAISVFNLCYVLETLITSPPLKPKHP